jgi:biopolymer transport protein TolQ
VLPAGGAQYLRASGPRNEITEAIVNDPNASLSIVTLFVNADVVVKGVLVLLLAASVWSWAVIIDKLWQLAAASRSARGHEARAAAAQTAQELLATEPRGRSSDPAALMLSAGWAERMTEPPPEAETAGERRERIERAMRLALNAELRRLEVRLPFLATLGSAAPFIGLFGTVWGIMRSFEGIAAAHNTSLAVVAPGIAEALFATAMGLAAAIPAVVAYNKITVDLGRFAGRMQGLMGRSAGLLSRTPVEA